MFCTDISSPIYFLFSGEISTLTYYAHLQAVVVALFVGFFVFFHNRGNLNVKILLSLCITFSIWSLLSLLTWVNVDSRIINISWSLIGIVFSLIPLLSFYFIYVTLSGRDLPFIVKLFSTAILLPILILTPTRFNLGDFDLINCEPVEGHFFYTYYYIISIFVFVGILIYGLRNILSNKGVNKVRNLLLIIGVECFLLLFISAGYLGSLLDSFDIEPYGIFGMTIFMAFLAYLIVKFKAFRIKLLWAQALVWALVILIGSQFAFVRNNTNRVLTGVTLVISAILGLMLVRGVKREIAQREEIQNLASNLEKANEGQSNLLHFITHQVKGYFTKSRNVFAELSTGDYGKLPEQAEMMIKEGFRSTTEGVDLVHNMLNAANIERGTMKYNKEDVDLKESLLDVIKQKKVSIEEKGLKLITNIGEGNLVISGDPLQIKEVMKNLIENSIRYTLKGSVEVGLELKENKILFNVKDTGVGVSAEDMPKLFKKGGHGSESTKVNPESTGYGLYIVKEIVEKHDGRVWVESEGKGKGSTFFVEFPVK